MRIQVRSTFAAMLVLTGSGASLSFAAMNLKKESVKEIRVQPMETGICPGGEIKFSVTAVLADGREVVTKGAGKGKVGWKNYSVSFEGGSTDDDKIKMLSDPRVAWAEPPTLRVVTVDHRDVTWVGTIPVRYDCAFSANYKGNAGSTGSGGSDGRKGERAGDYGESGRDGSDGNSGERGERVDVWVTTTTGPGSQPIVQVAVAGRSGERRYYALSPTGGSLTVDARGGSGGTGGSGGDGGRGGKASGGDREGGGGDGANGGCGGDGGDGGNVTLHLDPKARAYRSLVKVLIDGGDRGNGGFYGSGGGGSPKGRNGRTGCEGRSGQDGDLRTVEETVAPLW